jgi:hypothetical protein
MIEIGVRGVGPPPYFTGKSMLGLCLTRVRTSPRFVIVEDGKNTLIK